MPTDLYSLHEADSDRSSGSPTGLLQRQLDRGFVFLRFSPELEADFLSYMAVSGTPSRLAMLLVAFVAICITPLIDTRLLGLPEVLVPSSRLLQLGVMLPLVVVTGLFCWWRPYSRYIEMVMVVLSVGLVLGLLMQRIIDSRYGFDMPLDFVGIVIAAMFVLARIRFWITLPIAVIAMAAAVISEIWFVSPLQNAYYHLFSTLVLVVIGVFSGYSSEYFIRWTWLNGTLLQYLSRLDSLTGMLNRKALETSLDNARTHARREGLAYAVAMIDIDAFKAYNDHYGHPSGDVALGRVARILQRHARRPLDVCGRYGGEEFVALWMDCGVDQARALAESMRAAIEYERLVHAASPAASWVTVSVGVCHVSAAEGHISMEAALCEADRALYQAKASGRNQVHCGRPERLSDTVTSIAASETTQLRAAL